MELELLIIISRGFAPSWLTWYHGSQNVGTRMWFSVFTEIWVTPKDPPLGVDGFTAYTSPILAGKCGYLPGSCLIISRTLVTERPPVCEKLEKSCITLNMVCCFVVCKTVKMAVVSVYRSPSTNVKTAMDELQLIVTELTLQADHLIIAGDFNIDLLATSSVKVSYSNLLSDLHLVQHFSHDLLQPAINNTWCVPVMELKSYSIREWKLEVVGKLIKSKGRGKL